MTPGCAISRSMTESCSGSRWMIGRKAPIRPSRLLSRSTRPRATADFPEWASGAVMYRLRDMPRGYRGPVEPLVPNDTRHIRNSSSVDFASDRAYRHITDKSPLVDAQGAARMPDGIVVTDLVVRRGRSTVLNGLSCRVRAGRITGLLGPSGSGKTTLIRAIVGVQVIRSGTVTVLGSPAGSPSLRDRIGYVSQ